MVQAIGKDAIAFLRETPTGVVHDALGLSGLKGAVTGIRPARGFEDVRIAGPALTITFAMSKGTGAYPKSMYDIYYEAEPGQVIVMAAEGLDYAFSGDNQAHCAKVHGMEAIVIDGACRDVAGIREIGMPLFVTHPTTRVNVGQYDAVAVNEPVQVGGVRINPGDIVVGDEDGLIVVPQEAVETVIANIKVVNEVESQMEAAIREKRPVAEIKTILAKKKAKPAK